MSRATTPAHYRTDGGRRAEISCVSMSRELNGQTARDDATGLKYIDDTYLLLLWLCILFSQ